MPKKILVINGHPNRDERHFCWALASAYEEGAREGGHDVSRINIASMDYSILRDPDDFQLDPPKDVLDVQAATKAADHLCIVYPIWLGSIPALTKGFFERLACNGFAISASEKNKWPRRMLKGKSARVVVTMGMPATAYRMFFGAHGVRSFESGVLGMAGFKPVRDTLIGGVSPDLDAKTAARHLALMRRLGRHGD